MKSPYLKFLGLLFFVLVLCLPESGFSQKQPRNVKSRTKTTAPTAISAADQKAITELFKDVDPSKYRLQFNNSRTVLGAKQVSMSDLEQVKRVRNPVDAVGWIVFVVEGDDVIYVLAVGNSDLVSTLGKAKAAKLNKIMAKYSR